MRQALIKYNNTNAGILSELDNGEYEFQYNSSYIDTFPDVFISFNMPVSKRPYRSKMLFPF